MGNAYQPCNKINPNREIHMYRERCAQVYNQALRECYMYTDAENKACLVIARGASNQCVDCLSTFMDRRD